MCNYDSTSEWFFIFIFCQQNLNISSSYIRVLHEFRWSMLRCIDQFCSICLIFLRSEISEFVQSLSFPIDLPTSRFRNAHIGSFPYRVQSIFIEKPLIRLCLDLPKLRTRKTRRSPLKFCWGRKAKRFDYRP